MSFTIDFILIFILIIIPGLLFKRFYFFSEFSKQFSTKDSIYKSIFYSIIPGVLIQVASYLIYIWIRKPNFNNEDLICVFKELLSSSNFSYSENTIDLLNKKIHLFLLHEVVVFIFAIALGISLSRLIRFFKLDILTKVFRFKNQWYYIFSGEIRSFKKFKHANIILGEIKGKENKYLYYPPYVDVLVEGNSEPTLYTGYVIDYDLDYENVKDLDRIYLLGAHRYRYIREDEDLTDKEVSGNRIKVPIKGDVFILYANKILNMNITFIPSPIIKGKGVKTNNKWLVWIHYFGMLITLLIIIYLTVIKLPIVSEIFPMLTDYVKDFNFGTRFLLALVIIQIISIGLPVKEEILPDKSEEDSKKNTNYKYYWKNSLGKAIALVVLILIYYFVVY